MSNPVPSTLPSTLSSLVITPSESPPESVLDPINITWMILAPIIFIVGLVGNILILLVMTNRRMSGTSTSVHLTMMASADIIVLLVGLVPDWLVECDIYHLSDVHPIICKIIKFLFYTAGDTSIWILVMFTIDRFIAICFPLQKIGCCTTDRARIYDVCALGIAICKNIVVFWSRGIEYQSVDTSVTQTPQSTTPRIHSRYDDKSDPFFGYLAALTLESETTTDCCSGTPSSLVYDGYQLLVINKFCGYRPEFEYWIRFVRPWIVFVIVYLVPFAIIVICNFYIVRALLKVRKEHIRKNTIGTSGERSMIQMTMMCMSASIAFLIFIGPSIFVLIGKPYWPTQERAYKDAKAINNLFVYINHSINFFLYCITGHRFRRMILIVLRCRCLRTFDSSLDSLADFRRMSVDGRGKIAALRRARGRAYSDGLLFTPNGLFNMHRASSALLIDPLAVRKSDETIKATAARNGYNGSNNTIGDDSPCGYRSSARRKRESVRDVVARGSFCQEARESRREGRAIRVGQPVRDRGMDRPPPYAPPPPPPNEQPFPLSEIKKSPRFDRIRVTPQNSPSVLQNSTSNKSPSYLRLQSPSANNHTPGTPRLIVTPQAGQRSPVITTPTSENVVENHDNNASPKVNILYDKASPDFSSSARAEKALPNIIVFKETTC